MCGLALLETSKVINQKSRRVELYKFACVRSIRRALNSQHLNGAFPYSSYGLTVPLVYHAMTLSILIILSCDFDEDPLLDYSIKKGVDYLTKFIKKTDQWNGEKERFHEKAVYVGVRLELLCFF